MGAKAFARAGDGSDVAHVGDAVEYDDEGVDSSLGKPGHDIGKVGIGHARSPAHDALVVGAREALHALGRNKLDKNSLLARLRGNCHDGWVAGFLCDKDAVQNHFRLKSLFNGANSVN